MTILCDRVIRSCIASFMEFLYDKTQVLIGELQPNHHFASWLQAKKTQTVQLVHTDHILCSRAEIDHGQLTDAVLKTLTVLVGTFRRYWSAIWPCWEDTLSESVKSRVRRLPGWALTFFWGHLVFKTIRNFIKFSCFRNFYVNRHEVLVDEF